MIVVPLELLGDALDLLQALRPMDIEALLACFSGGNVPHAHFSVVGAADRGGVRAFTQSKKRRSA
jgi:hypothetical protein